MPEENKEEVEKPVPVIGERLKSMPGDRQTMVFIHTLEPMTDQQRLNLGEIVTNLAPSQMTVTVGNLERAILREEIINKFPFVVHIEATKVLKESWT